MKRLLAACLAITLLATGCSKHVDPPPADADSIEVLRVFLDAIIADDEETGKQIAGPCWAGVKDRFDADSSRIVKYEIPEDVTPRPPQNPEVLSTPVGLNYWSKSGEYHNRMVAFLKRESIDSPWMVCKIKWSHAP